MSSKFPVVRLPLPLDVEKREKILNLEREIAKLPQYECPLRHFFADGVYVREITIHAGVALVGYIHMQACVTTVSKGKIIIADGDSTRIIEAPFTMAVPPGSKKAGYALEDTVWSDAYANPSNETDLDVLESQMTAETHEEFERRFNLLEVKL